MPKVEARISEIQLDLHGRMVARIACPEPAVPAPGQYCLAELPGDRGVVLPVSLMAGETDRDGFLAVPVASSLPLSWVPGASLNLRGPLGRGFSLPEHLGRLALIACEDMIARLLPLAVQAAARGADISWFTDAPVPSLPAAYELNPLRLAPNALSWADFMVIEVGLLRLPELRRTLGLAPGQHLPCPVQALILADMPCAGRAECSVCAVRTRRGWRLACMDGPVFDLNELDW